MYICIDLLLVALIIKVSPSTLSVSRTFIFKRESVCKAVAELLKIDPHRLQKSSKFDLQGLKNQPKSTPRDPQNDQKCIPEATLLQRTPPELHFLKNR